MYRYFEFLSGIGDDFAYDGVVFLSKIIEGDDKSCEDSASNEPANYLIIDEISREGCADTGRDRLRWGSFRNNISNALFVIYKGIKN